MSAPATPMELPAGCMRVTMEEREGTGTGTITKQHSHFFVPRELLSHEVCQGDETLLTTFTTVTGRVITGLMVHNLHDAWHALGYTNPPPRDAWRALGHDHPSPQAGVSASSSATTDHTIVTAHNPDTASIDTDSESDTVLLSAASTFRTKRPRTVAGGEDAP